MEKIQKALDKARASREGPSQPLLQHPAAADGAVAPAIAYSRTRVVQADPKLLIARRVVAHANGQPLADRFRILRTQVMQKLAVAGHRTLAVTSPNADEGKTFIAVNLALSLAMIPAQTVLLVDLDLRRPGVHRCFGIEPKVGVTDYLLGNVPLADCLVNPGIERLVILPVGASLGASSEVLSSAKMLGLAKELKERYADRIVIYDLPPLLVTDDALMFLNQPECCLLVVAEGETQISDIERSLELLQSARVIGTVLNKAADRKRHYHYS
jgi:protein-tyrosine kinase